MEHKKENPIVSFPWTTFHSYLSRIKWLNMEAHNIFQPKKWWQSQTTLPNSTELNPSSQVKINCSCIFIREEIQSGAKLTVEIIIVTSEDQGLPEWILPKNQWIFIAISNMTMYHIWSFSHLKNILPRWYDISNGGMRVFP
jgi:hypothetical protein